MLNSGSQNAPPANVVGSTARISTGGFAVTSTVGSVARSTGVVSFNLACCTATSCVFVSSTATCALPNPSVDLAIDVAPTDPANEAVKSTTPEDTAKAVMVGMVRDRLAVSRPAANDNHARLGLVITRCCRRAIIATTMRVRSPAAPANSSTGNAVTSESTRTPLEEPARERIS